MYIQLPRDCLMDDSELCVFLDHIGVLFKRSKKRQRFVKSSKTNRQVSGKDPQQKE
jgi:hypothetical protein